MHSNVFNAQETGESKFRLSKDSCFFLEACKTAQVSQIVEVLSRLLVYSYVMH